jgi:hypothetical protein
MALSSELEWDNVACQEAALDQWWVDQSFLNDQTHPGSSFCDVDTLANSWPYSPLDWSDTIDVAEALAVQQGSAVTMGDPQLGELDTLRVKVAEQEALNLRLQEQ